MRRGAEGMNAPALGHPQNWLRAHCSHRSV